MKDSITKPTRIAVAWHPSLSAAERESEAVQRQLIDNGAVVADSFSLQDPLLREKISQKAYDLVIALGGDGTMLRAGKFCAPFQVPVMGINMGTLGFLIEIHRDNWQKYIPRLMNSEWKIEQRMMLNVKHFRGTLKLNEWEILNEVVVARGRTIRPIELEISVSGSPLTTITADGLITATATGSTAYAMAAGGPVLQPEMRNMIVVPISPHLSFDHALVLQEGETVEIAVKNGYYPLISPDGNEGAEVEINDRILVSASDYDTRFIRFTDIGFFYRSFTQYIQRLPSAAKGV